MTIRILVTGSREWTDRETLENELYNVTLVESQSGDEVVLVDGGCPTGADRMCRDMVKRGDFHSDITVRSETHPADWSLDGKAAGPIRNQHMVNKGAILCLAFPKGDSRGTWDCIKRANRAGIPVRIIPARVLR